MLEMETIDEQPIVRFLLGEMPEDGRLLLEERLFTDDRFYEQVLAIQEELVDDYVQDKLSSSRRARFEEYFLQSPRRRERVEFAAAFSRALASPGPRPLASIPWWESFAIRLRRGDAAARRHGEIVPNRRVAASPCLRDSDPRVVAAKNRIGQHGHRSWSRRAPNEFTTQHCQH